MARADRSTLAGQWPVCHCSMVNGLYATAQCGPETAGIPPGRPQNAPRIAAQLMTGPGRWMWVPRHACVAVARSERRGHMTRPGRRRGRAGSALLIFGHRMVTRPCHIRHIRAPPAPSRVSSNRRARHRSRAGEKDAVSYRPPGDRDDAAGREPPGWYVDPRSYLDPTGQQVLRWWDGTQWSQQTRPMPGRWQGPPIAQQPSGRQPWPRRYKVMTVLGSLAVLIIVIAGMASLGAKARQADNASAVATTTPTRTATPSRTPARHATSAKAVPTSAPLTAQAAAPAPATTAPAPATTAPAPVATTHAAAPPPPASTAPTGCRPLSDEGTCYEPGEYCRDDDHGVTGVAGDGKTITCEDNDGWRWEPA